MNLFYGISMLATLGLTTPAIAEPVELGDAELAQVSAGTYEVAPVSTSGVILGHASAGSLHATEAIELEGHAQSGVKAITLVNSASSSVANGSNIWYVPPAVAATHAVDDAVSQSNVMQQTPAAGAYLAEWRPMGGNSVARKTETFDSGFSGGIIAENVPLGTNPDSTESVNLGLGVAMAGEGSAEFGTFGLTFSDAFKSSLTTTTTTQTTVTFSLKFFKWRVSKTYTHTNTDIETTSVNELNTENRTWGPFSASFKGVNCLVLLGSCQAEGHYNTSTHSEETSLSPAQVQGASAQSIVLSDGSLFDVAHSTVQLQGHAQSDISALHVVNAAGSLSANGLNVSSRISTAPRPRAMQLQQSNLIAQRP